MEGPIERARALPAKERSDLQIDANSGGLGRGFASALKISARMAPLLTSPSPPTACRKTGIDTHASLTSVA